MAPADVVAWALALTFAMLPVVVVVLTAIVVVSWLYLLRAGGLR